jgi:hypothetical protein
VSARLPRLGFKKATELQLKALPAGFGEASVSEAIQGEFVATLTVNEAEGALTDLNQHG